MTTSTTYYAFSSTNGAETIRVYGTGDTKVDALTEAEENIVHKNGPRASEMGTNIYTDTLLKNLFVLSETAAKRKSYIPRTGFVARHRVGGIVEYRIEH